MFSHALMLGRRQGGFGFAHFVLRAVSDDDELAGFDLRLVPDDTVFGNPDAVECRSCGVSVCQLGIIVLRSITFTCCGAMWLLSFS
jgi:hypothetical protein